MSRMILSHFDLNLLKALDTLLDECNVTRAGERLHITQQAASAALSRLRLHFADELLVRVGRHLEPTPLAKSLIGPVKNALHAAQIALETTPLFDAQSISRSFTIAMSDYSIQAFLPTLLRTLHDRAPNIEMHVKPFDRDSFDKIAKGRLDFCITADDWRLYGEKKQGPDIRHLKLFSDDFVCVVDPELELPGGVLDVVAYQRLSHNSADFGEGVATLVERAWAKHDLQIKVAVTVPSFSALITTLPGTKLVATAQRRMAAILAPRNGLRILECPIEIATLQESLFWHKRNDDDPVSNFMTDVIVEASSALALLQ